MRSLLLIVTVQCSFSLGLCQVVEMTQKLSREQYICDELRLHDNILTSGEPLEFALFRGPSGDIFSGNTLTPSDTKS